VAQRLAAWVKQYGLDGVDIDYEDMPAMNSNQAEQWLITFQTTLRQLLPAPYLISHAPVAPWFTSGSNYPSGAYVSVHQQTGSGIDWYNVQFYNQGSGVYEDCHVSLSRGWLISELTKVAHHEQRERMARHECDGHQLVCQGPA